MKEKMAQNLDTVHTHTHILQNVFICYACNTMVEFVYSTELFSKEISFINVGKNKLNRNIKRIGYKKSEAAKLKIAYPFITKTCT